MKFKERILSHDPSIDHVPSGFNRYGEVMILRSQHPLSPELGELIIHLYPWCRGVFQHITTLGEFRRPQLIHLGGNPNPVVTHKENGILYHLDLSKITFSGGNRYLRERLVKEINDGEFVLDMFAAVGNLSLQPLIYRNIDALLVEKDPVTFKYLQTSLKLNDLSPNIAKHMDCRNLGLTNKADRILMGYHKVNRSHLNTALRAAASKCSVHLHPVTRINHWQEKIDYYTRIVEELGSGVMEKHITKVKDYSPGMEHIELVLQITK